MKSDLKSMAAKHAGKHLQESHNLLIDIVQHVRNEFTDGERMPDAIENRIADAFGRLQEGRDWVNALADE